MTQTIPDFPYHPDPLATGSVVSSDEPCACCGQVRGFRYTGPVYSTGTFGGQLCPWCIADGRAAERYRAQFSAGVDSEDEVSGDAVRAIIERTPGFTAWQDEQWLTHCGDGAAYLGPAGASELAGHPDAIRALWREYRGYGWPPDGIEDFLARLDKESQPTAYLFRCRVCGTHLAYADYT
ncbi:CbrC family protein [Streptomyces sp. NPDC006879]|uniref:CbrC family protein n=1 Tax=Streptomyces sp. NPDC006879 TaxID=3364767 RepID=UPI0036A56483